MLDRATDRMRDSRKLDDPSPARPEDRGNGETRSLGWEAESEKQSDGETRGFAYEAAKGCEIRGNSKIHRRHSRRLEDPGKPGASFEG